ncbi:hypothetical protein BT69DRAFT_1275412 [Atractiella rhizophila]|nr:hypothetical protein BT69DRAFT_1275412 [Atractiella rhizophila]
MPAYSQRWEQRERIKLSKDLKPSSPLGVWQNNSFSDMHRNDLKCCQLCWI